MKKFLTFLLIVMMLPNGAALAEIDAYTGASATKIWVAGDELAALEEMLTTKCDDLATVAETKAEGYTEPEGIVTAQIASVNPDGSVSISTISEWKYVNNAEGADQVVMELTQAQCTENLSVDNARGSLFVVFDGATYILHLDVVDVDEQVFEQAAYEAGEFNKHYIGNTEGLSSFTVTCDVLSIEKTYALIW